MFKRICLFTIWFVCATLAVAQTPAVIDDIDDVKAALSPGKEPTAAQWYQIVDRLARGTNHEKLSAHPLTTDTDYNVGDRYIYVPDGLTYEIKLDGTHFVVWPISYQAIGTGGDGFPASRTTPGLHIAADGDIYQFDGTDYEIIEPNLPDTATAGEATAGTETTLRSWSPDLVRQAIVALSPNDNPATVTPAEAAAGTEAALRSWSPDLVRQAVIALAPADNPATASAGEAAAGTEAALRSWSPDLVRQAIVSLTPGDNPATATPAEANDGTETALRSWSPDLVRQAIVSLAPADNPATASAGEATTGTETALRSWSPDLVRQAIIALTPGDNPTTATGVEAAAGTETALRSWSPDLVRQSIIALAPGDNPGTATGGEATAGTETALRSWSPDLVRQAVEALAPGTDGEFRVAPQAASADRSTPPTPADISLTVFETNSLIQRDVANGIRQLWRTTDTTTAVLVLEDMPGADRPLTSIPDNTGWLVGDHFAYKDTADNSIQFYEWYDNTGTVTARLLADGTEPATASAGESTTGTETALRNFSPDLIRQAIVALSPNDNPATATAGEAAAGTEAALRSWSPDLVRQAIIALAPGDNPTTATLGEATTGTESAIRSWSPDLVHQAAISASQHWLVELADLPTTTGKAGATYMVPMSDGAVYPMQYFASGRPTTAINGPGADDYWAPPAGSSVVHVDQYGAEADTPAFDCRAAIQTALDSTANTVVFGEQKTYWFQTLVTGEGQSVCLELDERHNGKTIDGRGCTLQAAAGITTSTPNTLVNVSTRTAGSPVENITIKNFVIDTDDANQSHRFDGYTEFENHVDDGTTQLRRLTVDNIWCKNCEQGFSIRSNESVHTRLTCTDSYSGMGFNQRRNYSTPYAFNCSEFTCKDLDSAGFAVDWSSPGGAGVGSTTYTAHMRGLVCENTGQIKTQETCRLFLSHVHADGLPLIKFGDAIYASMSDFRLVNISEASGDGHAITCESAETVHLSNGRIDTGSDSVETDAIIKLNPTEQASIRNVTLDCGTVKAALLIQSANTVTIQDVEVLDAGNTDYPVKFQVSSDVAGLKFRNNAYSYDMINTGSGFQSFRTCEFDKLSFVTNGTRFERCKWITSTTDNVRALTGTVEVYVEECPTLEPHSTAKLVVGGVAVSYTTTQMEDAADEVNTTGKRQGKAVLNSTTGKVLYATGSGTTDTWTDSDGVVQHTPS